MGGVNPQLSNGPLLFLQKLTVSPGSTLGSSECHEWVAQVQRMIHNLGYDDPAAFFKDSSLVSLAKRCLKFRETQLGFDLAYLFNLMFLALRANK